MKLNYNFRKRKMSFIETITKNSSPHKLHLHFNTKGMYNMQQNYFEKAPKRFAKWIYKSQFISTNLFMRLMSLLTSKSFKKQYTIYINDFKNYAEKGISIKRCVN